MRASRARRHRGRVPVLPPPRPTIDASPSLFLVELRATSASSADVAGMHRALRLAVARLGSTGVPIRWLSGVVVPSEFRCLCFLQAHEEGQVARARDTAGLPNASIRPVVPIPDDPSPPSRTTRPDPSPTARPDPRTIRRPAPKESS
jgi:hypothetical protein